MDMNEQAAIFKAMALQLLKSAHEDYEAVYKEYTEVETPGKKKWLETIGQPDSDTVGELESLFDGINELATSEEVTPEELNWLLKRSIELTKTLRSYLSSLYHALATNDDGIKPEEVQAKLKAVTDAFDAAMSYVNMGVISRDEISATVPTTERGVRAAADGTPQTKFSYNPTGKVRKVNPAKQGAARANSTKWKLVVDGNVVSESTGRLGDALRVAGLGTCQDLARAYEAKFGKHGWSPKYYDQTVELKGHRVNLKKAH